MPALSLAQRELVRFLRQRHRVIGALATPIVFWLLVGGGIGVAPLPYLSQELDGPPAILGFRSERHAEAAVLLPGAEVCIEPTYVTALLPEERNDVLACGPEPMLAALRALVPDAQLAWEAPMACGYGACYGCAVEIDGELKRLCVEGPVLCAA